MAASHRGQRATAHKVGQGARNVKHGHDNHENVGCDTKGLLNEDAQKEEEKRYF